jgi:hypothetical protein
MNHSCIPKRVTEAEDSSEPRERRVKGADTASNPENNRKKKHFYEPYWPTDAWQLLKDAMQPHHTAGAFESVLATHKRYSSAAVKADGRTVNIHRPCRD